MRSYLPTCEAGARRLIALGNQKWIDMFRDGITKSTEIPMGFLHSCLVSGLVGPEEQQ